MNANKVQLLSHDRLTDPSMETILRNTEPPGKLNSRRFP